MYRPLAVKHHIDQRSIFEEQSAYPAAVRPSKPETSTVPYSIELPSPPMPSDVHFGKQMSPLYRAWADKCALIVGTPERPMIGPVTIDVKLSGQEQFVRAVMVADMLAELGVFTGPRKVNAINHDGESVIATLYYCVSIS